MSLCEHGGPSLHSLLGSQSDWREASRSTTRDSGGIIHIHIQSSVRPHHERVEVRCVDRGLPGGLLMCDVILCELLPHSSRQINMLTPHEHQ